MIIPSALALVVGVYLAEAYFAYEVWEIELGTGGRIERAARDAGADWDSRTKEEMIRDMIAEGKDTYPTFAPSVYWDVNGLAYKGDRIMPFGGVSRSWAVFCQEMGPWSAYPTDEYGFNNPLGLYKKGALDAAVIGDSFVNGACVEPGDDITGIMRSEGIKAVNLGIGGVGPVTYLAVQREFAKPVEPKIVFWVFYAVDIRDSVAEVQSDILKNYLDDPDFTQNLAARQDEIDAFLRDYLATEYEKRLNQLTELRQKRREIITARLIDEGLRLKRVKERLRNMGGRDEVTEGREEQKLGLLKTALQRAKAETESWGGKFVFVYIPDWYAYHGGYDTYGIKIDDNFLLRQDVLKMVKEMGIDVVDVEGEIFDKHPDPLSLYNWRTYGHYTPEGYRLIGERMAAEAEKILADRESGSGTDATSN
ncbi:hypothetical protein [Hoeflea sp.]|uniref:hypothetical protein n=1 Tax=Hoeflea sp. TaxID=1940281 RepID=UPI003A90AD2B